MTDLSDSRAVLLAPHPFWATLSPTTVQQRIEQLLAAPDSAALVQALSPVEYAVLLKAAPDMRALLLQLGHPEQIRTVARSRLLAQRHASERTRFRVA